MIDLVIRLVRLRRPCFKRSHEWRSRDHEGRVKGIPVIFSGLECSTCGRFDVVNLRSIDDYAP